MCMCALVNLCVCVWLDGLRESMWKRTGIHPGKVIVCRNSLQCEGDPDPRKMCLRSGHGKVLISTCMVMERC